MQALVLFILPTNLRGRFYSRYPERVRNLPQVTQQQEGSWDFHSSPTNSQVHALPLQAIPKLSTTGDKESSKKVPTG